MYAIIETGGKQYRVQQGDVLDVERLPSVDASGDASIVFDRVLLVGDGDSVRVGTPTVAGATVTADAIGEIRGPKVIVFKKKRRKGYRRKNGHRQNLLRVRIAGIDT
ncbi:MAG: 50S ribosomal protein L21 [Acidobacteriota bacterium]